MIISPQNEEAVMTRFYDFQDAVVEHVCLSTGSSTKGCIIRVKAQDTEAESGWSLVEFDLSRVHEFRFQYGKSTYEVLSSGLQLMRKNELLYIILDAYPDDDGFPDLTKNMAFASGEQCDLKVIKKSL